MNINAVIKKVSTYFILAVILKIGLSISGLMLNDPIWLGFALPLTVMLGYWILGYQVRRNCDQNLTTAKFADSVYYLGFLFTIASIIICLVDIARIGDDLSFMAIRFGAAMVSTAVGMLARVLHTGFDVDANDALQNMEEKVIQSAENLAISFDNTFNSLEVFRDKVNISSQEAVHGVQEQIELLYTHCINTMDTFFTNATQNSNEAFTLIIEDAKSASEDLLKVINNMSEKSVDIMARMERDTIDFGDKTRIRLEGTLFPDDLFIKKLNPSIDILSGTTDDVHQSIITLADDVKKATHQVSTAIKGINTKAIQLETNLENVNNIVGTQKILINSITVQSQVMLDRVERQHSEFINAFKEYKESSQEELNTSQHALSKFVQTLEGVSINLANVTSLQKERNELYETLRGETAFSLKEVIAPLIKAVTEINHHNKSEPQLQHDEQKSNSIHYSNEKSKTLEVNDDVIKAQSTVPAAKIDVRIA